jgi:hypothetical protein
MSPSTETAPPSESGVRPPAASLSEGDLASVREQVIAAHGQAERARVERCLPQVAARWTEADGDAEAFAAFCRQHYVSDPAERDRLLARLERALELIDGHLYETRRSLRRWSDLAGDRMPAVDGLLATFDPAPALSEELYAQKLAFLALLNFERPSLAEMLAEGGAWDESRWVAARVAGRFGPRLPSELNNLERRTFHEAGRFVDGFHVRVDGLAGADGRRWFAPGRKLVAHWLIREQIKAGYAEPDGLARQRALGWVMRRHVDGSTPRALVVGDASPITGDPESDHDSHAAGLSAEAAAGRHALPPIWDPETNTLAGEPVTPAETVGLERYERWLEHFAVARVIDDWYPEHPTAIARKFELNREIPEQEVEKLLLDLLEAPLRGRLAGLVSAQLGRPLEAHDIYYENPIPKPSAADLNARLAERYPDAAAMQRGLPELLRGLGWSDADADFYGERVWVEIAAGAGHAMPAGLPEYAVWLRTNSLDGQLGWDGFDIAMHELGHNLEQLCSMHLVSRPALKGVPNNACTEAFAFLYQSLAPRAAGIPQAAGGPAAEDAEAIEAFLAACQIAGPGLVELRAWRWLYANPDADAAALREAVIDIAGQLWERFYAPHFGPDRYHLLAAYQHMVGYPLYLPDYALGHVISHQIAAHVRAGDLATETKRICGIGRLTPDAWMREAVGAGIDAAPLIRDAEAALARVRGAMAV